MNVWAIADLHLSLAGPERRGRHGGRWQEHATKIEAGWREAVRPHDMVLLPGDLSMARNHRDVQPDLAWIDRLPGTKVLSPGNHDAWWNGAEKIRPFLRRSLRAVDGDALTVGGTIICGARGAEAPAEDLPPGRHGDLDREVEVLKRALEQAAELRVGKAIPIYVQWHYPPFDRYGRPGPAVPLLEAAGVSACVYGHLHTRAQWSRAVQGRYGGVRYFCVAADAVGFRPLHIDTV
jgi:predicted phosphohydrolase